MTVPILADAAPRATGMKPGGSGNYVMSPRPQRPIPARLVQADRPATTLLVTNCNDSGNGSLRDAANHAIDGDTIDLSQLNCSTITLTTGYIALVNDVTLDGPGRDLLTISGANTYGVLQHFGAGTLFLNGLTIADGKYVSDPFPLGGCIYSQDSVSLYQVNVESCVAIGTGNVTARGGGVYAAGSVTLINSSVSGNTADQISDHYAAGGGVFAGGSLNSKYSTIADNTSYASSISWNGVAGGAWVVGDATILFSTISGNQAETVGALYLGGSAATGPLFIANSTISGNAADNSLFGAGVFAGYPIQIENSTITGNIESNSSNAKYGAGLSLGTNVIAELESTIIAGNYIDTGSGLIESDINQAIGRTGASLTGANDLIGLSFLTTPPGTIASDPQLGPLANNGGPTLTHSLAPSSPAINAGNNVGGWGSDQRGSGFPRVVGASADIGAIEYSDVIFANGFD